MTVTNKRVHLEAQNWVKQKYKSHECRWCSRIYFGFRDGILVINRILNRFCCAYMDYVGLLQNDSPKTCF